MSTITMAGIGTTALIELLPKSAIVSICVILCGIVTYFARRDWQRFKQMQTENHLRLQNIEAYQRKVVTVEEHRESMTGVHRKIDTLHGVHESGLNGVFTRLTVIETLQTTHAEWHRQYDRDLLLSAGKMASDDEK